MLVAEADVIRRRHSCSYNQDDTESSHPDSMSIDSGLPPCVFGGLVGRLQHGLHSSVVSIDGHRSPIQIVVEMGYRHTTAGVSSSVIP